MGVDDGFENKMFDWLEIDYEEEEKDKKGEEEKKKKKKMKLYEMDIGLKKVVSK